MTIDVSLPQDPILVRLLDAARLTDEIVIFDDYGFQKTYAQLLGDIIATRNALRDSLPSAICPGGLITADWPYVGAVTHGGYEFIVSFFAIRALGGACFPFSSAVLPDDARHYLVETNAVAILAGRGSMESAREISALMKADTFVLLEVSTNSQALPASAVSFNKAQLLDPQGPGVVMCTSGTTGIPKALILPRQCLVQSEPLKLGKATLSYRPPHWRGGFASAILPVLSAHKLYSTRLHAGPDVMWELLRKHHITVLIFNPVLLRKMKEYYESDLAHLVANVRSEYVEGFKRLGSIRCSGAFLSPILLRFYTELTALPFKNAYGQTESGASVTEVDVYNPTDVKYSVGIVVRDHPVQVKLSEDTYGEFLVKTPWMMKGYINNEEATRAAFTVDGWLKTGDVGQRVGEEFIFKGRANDDFIGHVPRIPVEFAVQNLSYVAEGYVLRINDYEERAICAALIRLKPNTVVPKDMTIAQFHEDLSTSIPAYMRPYLLRVLLEGEEIPYTASQKPNKPAILKEFFGVTDFWNAQNPPKEVQVWPMRLSIHSQPTAQNHKSWDFASW